MQVSITVDGEPLALSAAGRNAGLVDWRITARPPLSVRNTLPVAGHFEVWERDRRVGPLALRERGRVEGGHAAPIHSVDLRRQVRSLQFAVECMPRI